MGNVVSITIMKTFKFRPHESYPLRVRKALGVYTGFYNWHIREYYSRFIERCGGRLHYLADHAPSTVQLKYKRIFKRFVKLHPKF